MAGKKIAEEYSPGSALVMVDKRVDGSCTVIMREEALAEGYEIIPAPAHTRCAVDAAPAPTVAQVRDDVPGQTANAATLKLAWLMAITNSPEARGREAAVEALIARYSPESLSTNDARSFLRGLPIEQSEPKAPKVTKTNDPRAARIAEIQSSMASFNSDRGYKRAAPRSTNSQVSGSALSGIEPAKLKRLTELRLNALEEGHANATDGEAKKLRYAIQVHEQTGLPLANVFAQLSVDTSKIVR